MSIYGVFSGLYFPVFAPSTGKYGPEKAPYMDTFHAVSGTFVLQIIRFLYVSRYRNSQAVRLCTSWKQI